MKVFIAGATGRVAEELIKPLTAAGHEVYAGARKPEKVISGPSIHPITLDLHADVSNLCPLLEGMDAVYFVAGSRGRDLLQTDVYGAIKLMQAAELVGVRRFIMLSSLFALEPDKWHLDGLNQMMDYNIAKYLADNYLMHQTNLDYTIFQPGALLEKEGTGLVQFYPQELGGNPIPDVAQVLSQLLDKKESYGKVLTMISGQEPIDQALDNL